MGNAQKERLIDKEIYQNHHMIMTPLVKHTSPPSSQNMKNLLTPPHPSKGIRLWVPLKLKDRGQDLTGTISWTNLPLKKQIHQFMFHSINIGISTFISAGQKNDSLTILLKMKFPEMIVRSKKGKLTSNRSLPESLPPTEVSASQHSLRVYLQITYWKFKRYNKTFD